ncbi:ABC transporter substrate-binding protein [Sorangium cellulosum]|uniref:ABC transporter substrate-binding protein n=2 Tax=Sorangium cellulosum TaxID=56 RepID=A0A4P2Q323_SORCE|nr:ABC transporter substrate-binding protein [Sorangium cellulosum]
MPSRMGRARDLKVGLFVLAGLLLSALVIFLIGDERRLFDSSVEFTTNFVDVQGLKPGAPVRMGGIDIGHVAQVGYGPDPKDTRIYVKLEVVESEAGRIRTDSMAQIANKGLLGDKMLEITKGQSAESVPPGGHIPGDVPTDMMGKVSGMAEKAEATLDNIQKVSQSFADEKLHKDLHETVASVNSLMKQVTDGEGYPRRFLTDPEEAERISRAVQSIDRMSTELASTLREVRGVVSRVKEGPGFAHDVIYGDGPQKQIQQFGNAADELAVTLRGIRESDSLAHDALYGGEGDGAEALANVTAMTGDLRAIVRDMRAGKGTLGALLVDPSIYEDMKSLLGNVQRNDVLRALVRYSIKQDEQKPAVQVGGATPPSP